MFLAKRKGGMSLSRGSRAFLLSVVLLGVTAVVAPLALPATADG